MTDSNLETSWKLRLEQEVIKLKAELEAALAEVERLKKRLTDEERDCLKVIDERDFREEQINQIADALGDETEWTSANDRGVNAIELASELTEARAEIERLKEILKTHKEYADIEADQLITSILTIAEQKAEIEELKLENESYRAKLAKLVSDLTLVQNLAAVIGEDDTLSEYKDGVWQQVRAIREEARKSLEKK
jgi:chromosome segregation ATPase